MRGLPAADQNPKRKVCYAVKGGEIRDARPVPPALPLIAGMALSLGASAPALRAQEPGSAPAGRVGFVADATVRSPRTLPRPSRDCSPPTASRWSS